jgi:hypothetical protein
MLCQWGFFLYKYLQYVVKYSIELLNKVYQMFLIANRQSPIANRQSPVANRFKRYLILF